MVGARGKLDTVRDKETRFARAAVIDARLGGTLIRNSRGLAVPMWRWTHKERAVAKERAAEKDRAVKVEIAKATDHERRMRTPFLVSFLLRKRL